MATTEDRVDKLEEKYSNLHTVVNVLSANVNNLANELRDFKQEMRQQNEMRANEIAETRKDIASIRASGWVQTGTILLGIAAMVIAVLSK